MRKCNRMFPECFTVNSNIVTSQTNSARYNIVNTRIRITYSWTTLVMYAKPLDEFVRASASLTSASSEAVPQVKDFQRISTQTNDKDQASNCGLSDCLSHVLDSARHRSKGSHKRNSKLSSKSTQQTPKNSQMKRFFENTKPMTYITREESKWMETHRARWTIAVNRYHKQQETSVYDYNDDRWWWRNVHLRNDRSVGDL